MVLKIEYQTMLNKQCSQHLPLGVWAEHIPNMVYIYINYRIPSCQKCQLPKCYLFAKSQQDSQLICHLTFAKHGLAFFLSLSSSWQVFLSTTKRQCSGIISLCTVTCLVFHQCHFLTEEYLKRSLMFSLHRQENKMWRHQVAH